MSGADLPSPQPFMLDGDRIRLRDFRPSDVDDALDIVGDDRVTVWLSFNSRDREGAERMIQAAIAASEQAPRTEYYLAVAEPEHDRVVGFARLALGGVQAGKLGYAIRPERWGQGLATTAVRTLVNYGFEELKLHRITAAIGPDNTGSIRVVERIGFEYEGRLRDHVHTNGAWRDSLLYSLIADRA